MTEETQNSKTRKFIAYWDCLGFETLFDIGAWERRALLDRIAGRKSPLLIPVNIKLMLLRAQANPQRFPEVWIFDAIEDFTEEELWEIARTEPQVLADSIRNVGKCLYKQPKQKGVIE
jgi:hypothetical protein